MLLPVLTLTLRFDDFILVFPVSEKKKKKPTILDDNYYHTQRERERERVKKTFKLFHGQT
jgi:hypothetical protein